MDRNVGSKIELLAPARDVATACAAVDCGADAVYMGGPCFGARHAAGNQVADIAEAARYAHLFGARLYVTFNTLLYEDELESARSVALRVIEAGADALIVQDMAYMEMGLTGVEFHASTQTFNASAEKVKFLGKAGFSRVILERGISLDDIKAIRAATDVELECFVHGALCVCYSGRCYMSRTMSARSGNRGDCSQPCRLPYDLCDGSGRVLLTGKHLLSLKDLNLSDRVGDLLDAGVTSFKIEGRLKDAAYVKNVVSWYRRRLDDEIGAREGLRRASVGKSRVQFEPDITRTFSRGYTQYYFDGRCAGAATPDSPKAKGAFAGTVVRSGSGWVELRGPAALSSGDGICFMVAGELAGTNVNEVEGGRVVLNRKITLPVGTEIYRNYDRLFEAALERGGAKRSIGVSAAVTFGEGTATVSFTDEEGIKAVVSCVCDNGCAREPAKMIETVKAQLSRSGETCFRVEEVSFPDMLSSGFGVPFMKASQLNALRREGLEKLLSIRMERMPERIVAQTDPEARYPSDGLSAFENVTNSFAERFYGRFGASVQKRGYDLRRDLCGVAVMTTPYCVRRENGMCLKQGNEKEAGPLWLRHGSYIYRLEFDCRNCLMRVIYEGSGRSGEQRTT